MQTIKASHLFFSLICLLLSSCDLSPTAIPTNLPVASETQSPTITITSTPLITEVPMRVPTVTPTNVPLLIDKPGLIVTLDTSGIPIFSPDGKTIAIVGSNITVWDANTHQLLRELKNPYDCGVDNAVFNPKGDLFAVSATSCAADGTNIMGHLLVWDFVTGDLLQDFTREVAKMPPSSGSSTSFEYLIPVNAMVFLPNSTKIIFASGNALEIKDVFQNGQSDVIRLGSKMFASQISSSSDGRLAYVLMFWEKTHNFPSLWTQQYKLQVWNINTHSMIREIKYPEGWAIINLDLLGTSVIQTDIVQGTNQIFNLETNEVRNLPYRNGWKYYNSDASLMVCARFFGLKDDEQNIELWNTNNSRNIYTFMPDFGKDWVYGLGEIIFSPDNTIMAIPHQNQVSLWNIRSIVKP